jgi:hypothetical protein
MKEVTVMNSTVGTNSAGTKEWLHVAKDMCLTAAEPLFSRSETTIVRPADGFTKQDPESALKKASRRASASQSAAKRK